MLAHERHGSGAPLVVLPGLLGRAANFRTVARMLGERHEVFVLDQRNHGESAHGLPMDFALLAADAAATIAALGLDGVDLLGHSMGGKTAMSYALTRPAALRRLLVVDIAPVTYGDRWSTTFAALCAIDLATLPSRAAADEAVRGAIPDEALRQFLLHNLAGSAGRWHWRCDLGAIARALPALIDFPQPAAGQTWMGPATLLAGGRSPWVDAAGESAFLARFPAGRVVRIAERGHWMHAEDPQGFVAAVETALAAGDAAG